jgi:predicted ATP-grasp superfamily ATP-dependent carboligase
LNIESLPNPKEHASVSPKRIIVTGGRSPAALELSRLLHAGGHTVLAAESWRRHLCRASNSVSASFELPPPRTNPAGYAEALRSVIVACKADLVIPTCEEIYTIARYREMLSEYCDIFSEPLPVLAQLHHKGIFIQLAEAFGLNVPRTRMAESREELVALAEDRGLFPDGVVMKPVYSRFASKVLVFPQRALNLTKAVKSIDSISATYPWVVQSYLPGRQLCTYSIAHHGVLTAHTAYWTKYTAGKGASVHFEHVLEKESLHFVEALVQGLSFTGQIAFDFKEDREGRLLPLECNPRSTSGIHLLADTPGIDLAFISPSARSGREIEFPAARKPSMLGSAMLLGGWKDRRTVRAWNEWLSDWVRGRDVLFRWNDPMPALEQLTMLGQLSMERMRTGLSFMELTTADIEWNGET